MDVRRYLADEPVQACPPSVGYRLRKFTRRNKQALAVAAVLVTGFAVLVGGYGWVAYDRAARRTALAQQVAKLLDESHDWQRRGNWKEALASATRAHSLAADGGAREELRRRVDLRQADLGMAALLDETYLRWGGYEDAGLLERTPGLLTDEEVDRAYAEAFRAFGVDVAALEPTRAAQALLDHSIREEITVALDHWVFVRRWRNDPAGADHVLRVVRLLDGDPWRTRMRDVAAAKKLDHAALANLARSIPVEELPPATILQLADVLLGANQAEQAGEVLRRAQRRHPNHLYINVRLAAVSFRRARWEDTIRFASVAVAARPESPHTLARLSMALTRKGDLSEAVAVGREAVRLNSRSAFAHRSLGLALEAGGEYDAAIREYRQAIQLGFNPALAHHAVARVLAKQERWAEALVELKRAVQLDPEDWAVVDYLGEALVKNDRLDDAIRTYQEAVRAKPDAAERHEALGDLWFRKGAWDEAAAAYSEAVRLDPQSWWTRLQLGSALQRRGEWAKSVAPLDAAVKLRPHDVRAHSLLGRALYETGEFEAALNAFARAMERDRDNPEVRFGLAAALAASKQWDRAAKEYAAALGKVRFDDNPKPGLWVVIADHGELFNLLRQSRPTDHLILQTRGRAFAVKGNWEAAAADFALAIEKAGKTGNPWLGPQASVALDASQWGEVRDRLLTMPTVSEQLRIAATRRHAASGRYREAAETLQPLLHKKAGAFDLQVMAILLAAQGDTAGLRRVCEELLQRDAQPKWVPEAERSAKVCSLVPKVMQHRQDRIIALADYAVSKAATHPAASDVGWFHFTQGLVRYRAGEFKAARAALAKSQSGQEFCAVASRLVSVMIDFRTGQATKARKDYKSTVVRMGESKADSRYRALFSHEMLLCEILRREAEQLLKQDPGSAEQK
jgi:tetratricopeptide (TPR) repeat protein